MLLGDVKSGFWITVGVLGALFVVGFVFKVVTGK